MALQRQQLKCVCEGVCVLDVMTPLLSHTSFRDQKDLIVPIEPGFKISCSKCVCVYVCAREKVGK